MVKSEEWLMHRVRRGTAGAFVAQTIWDPSDANRVDSFIALTNQVHDTSLADFWSKHRAEAANTTITYRPALQLISQNKPCNQSSISEWSTHQNPQQDAAGAVNGAIDGKGKFHTALELDPWWEIDLTAVFLIDAIAIYNIAFHAKDRFRNFRISIADIYDDWHDTFVKIDNQDVGGLASRPFTLPLTPPIRARYLRITMIGENFLHLDQVEIFGTLA